MEIRIANHSHYPRIGDKDEQLKLRRAYHLFDRKKIDARALQQVRESTISDVIDEQQAAGLDVITDGRISWNDPISHLMKHFGGVEIRGLLRFFDTNFYFRQPVVIGKLSRKGSALKNEVEFLRKNKGAAKIKLSLTGPYTLAQHSKIQTDLYPDGESLADALTDLIAEELRECASLGIDQIQIEEPSYLVHPPDWRWAERSLKRLSSVKGKSELILATFFGDAVPLYDELQKLPVDVLGLDVTYSPKLLSHIHKQGSKKGLQLGLLDGRNTKLEKRSEMVDQLLSVTEKLSGNSLCLTTSCGLEYLSRDRASDKLQLLKEIRDEYQKKKGSKKA